MPVIVHIPFPLILLRSQNKAYYHPNIIDPFSSILYFTVAVYWSSHPTLQYNSLLIFSRYSIAPVSNLVLELDLGNKLDNNYPNFDIMVG